ncbi:MAG: phosphoribosyltransferase domain-containing protein, partial [Actinomycetota bacterium]|nr:phosphoribosyltransferase domain-containing protein [Actinomycetota bacterium]
MTATATGLDLSSVVEGGLGLAWQVHASPSGLGVADLAGLALRDNPRRAQLVVSRVLAKHLPVPGAVAEAAGHALGRSVARLLGDGPPPVVLGYCETATALGQLVAEACAGSDYVHTTRRPEPDVAVLGGFEEEHSHATSHVLQPRQPAPLSDRRRPLVLVDDELTTGTTVLNTVAELPPHDRVVVATLLDLRPPVARQAFAARAAERGVQVRVVASLDGALCVP